MTQIYLRVVQQIINARMYENGTTEAVAKDIVAQILETMIRKEAEIILEAEKGNHQMVILGQVIQRLLIVRRDLRLHRTARRQVQIRAVRQVQAAEDLLRATVRVVVQAVAVREAAAAVEIDN